MEQRLQEIAADLLKIAHEIEKAPQVEAEEPRVNYIPCFSNFIPRSSNN